MSASTPPPSRETGRLGSYVIRNRQLLIRSAQQVLATQGRDASTKELASAAGMSVGSIYQHFGSKEGLVQAAIAEALDEWNRWVEELITGVDDPLERLIIPMRMILRLASTHPEFAALFSNCSATITEMIVEFTPSEPFRAVSVLVESGDLTIDDIGPRTQTVLSSVAMLALIRFRSGEGDDAHADRSIGFILEMLGLSPAEATQLVNRPLPVHVSA